MEQFLKIALRRTIIKINNPYPPDDFIVDYSDFLKVRDYLALYKFNPKVLHRLLLLTIELWHTEKRISRMSLLLCIRKYFFIGNESLDPHFFRTFDGEGQFSETTSSLLYSVSRMIFEEGERLSRKQQKEARQIASSILFGVAATAKEEEWLCAHYHLSEPMLNRLLRYPARSPAISQWARLHYEHKDFRTRRAELLSWIIDEAPTFEVSPQTLIDDFEVLNAQDLAAIKQYEAERNAKDIVDKELGDMLYRAPVVNEDLFFLEKYYHDSSSVELKLSRRFYGPHRRERYTPSPIPDFNELRKEFYENLEALHKITMIWAIFYSRLPQDQKVTLLKKYYSPGSAHSLFRVAKNMSNLTLLQWMLELG